MKNHHAGKTFMSPPLLFPWPRSGPPTSFILESPLVVTLKIYIAGLDRLCTTRFLTLLHPSLGYDPYFGNYGATSTYQPLC